MKYLLSKVILHWFVYIYIPVWGKNATTSYLSCHHCADYKWISSPTDSLTGLVWWATDIRMKRNISVLPHFHSTTSFTNSSVTLCLVPCECLYEPETMWSSAEVCIVKRRSLYIYDKSAGISLSLISSGLTIF